MLKFQINLDVFDVYLLLGKVQTSVLALLTLVLCFSIALSLARWAEMLPPTSARSVSSLALSFCESVSKRFLFVCFLTDTVSVSVFLLNFRDF